MDASVNMKMSPEEHRLIRSAVEDSKQNAHAINNAPVDAYSSAERRAARERAMQLDDLLKKL